MQNSDASEDFPTLDEVLERVKRANYLNLSTVSKDAEPNGSKLFFAEGRHLRFYWLSTIEAQHSQSVINNGRAYVVINDDNDQPGTGVGLYFNGYARLVKDTDTFPSATNETEREFAIRMLRQKSGHVPEVQKLLASDSPRHVFCVELRESWCNGAVREHDMDVDYKRSIPVRCADFRRRLTA